LRSNLAGKRSLVVEDNRTNQRILTHWLQKFGMQSVAVDTSQEA
jgi:CheY-like chemotaxis protein